MTGLDGDTKQTEASGTHARSGMARIDRQSPWADMTAPVWEPHRGISPTTTNLQAGRRGPPSGAQRASCYQQMWWQTPMAGT